MSKSDGTELAQSYHDLSVTLLRLWFDGPTVAGGSTLERARERFADALVRAVKRCDAATRIEALRLHDAIQERTHDHGGSLDYFDLGGADAAECCRRSARRSATMKGMNESYLRLARLLRLTTVRPNGAKHYRPRVKGEPTVKQIEAVQLLNECGGNKSAAARRAGIKRGSFNDRYAAACRKVPEAKVYKGRAPRPQRLRRDRRGQEDVATEDDRRKR